MMDTLEAVIDIGRGELSQHSPAGLTVPVILSGGAGTRLWPLSRESLPKQFWALVSEETLLQETLRRVTGDEFEAPIIVCNQEHRFVVADQMRTAGLDGARIILEPLGRNSAPAIAVAALLLAERDPDVVFCLMTADGMISDERALRRALATAAACAREGRIVTIGIRPTRPETGYGYIEVACPLDAAEGAFGIARFIEKPNLDHAGQLVASGICLWNSGIFVATARTLLAELGAHAPQVLHHAKRAIDAARRDATLVWLDADAFAACPSISLDYAVAERTALGAVVPADLGWSDIGSWDALWDVSAKDACGNVAIGDTMIEDTENCYVRSDGTLTAVIGLKDAVVISTADVVLALHRDQAQNVKPIVERLRQAGRPEAVTHKRVHRPWGYYESIASGPRYQVKRIMVKPGAELSLQKHFHRAEHWIVVEGTGLITRGDEQFLVSENENAFLPLGRIHKIKNPGRVALLFIEVQSGSYLGEDDIVRIEDSYGRV